MKGLLALVLVMALTSAAGAEIVTRTIDYKHGDVELQGFLAYDDSIQGKRPGVLVVHEWWGHGDYVRDRARQLAELGYVAFALDMFGKGKLTDDPAQAGAWAGALYSDRQLLRDRAMAGLETLKAQEQVDPEKLAVMGYCFGGSVSLELARAGADIDAAISFHGGLKTTMPAQPGQVKASILILHGAADPLVPPEEVAAFQQEMHDAKADWVFVSYADAVHSFTSREADKRDMEGVGYNARADARSWRAMKDFLAEVFAD